MSRAALAAGLSALWLAESFANPDDVEAEYQFDVSQRLSARVDDWEGAFDAFASEEIANHLPNQNRRVGVS